MYAPEPETAWLLKLPADGDGDAAAASQSLLTIASAVKSHFSRIADATAPPGSARGQGGEAQGQAQGQGQGKDAGAALSEPPYTRLTHWAVVLASLRERYRVGTGASDHHGSRGGGDVTTNGIPGWLPKDRRTRVLLMLSAGIERVSELGVSLSEARSALLAAEAAVEAATSSLRERERAVEEMVKRGSDRDRMLASIGVALQQQLAGQQGQGQAGLQQPGEAAVPSSPERGAAAGAAILDSPQLVSARGEAQAALATLSAAQDRLAAAQRDLAGVQTLHDGLGDDLRVLSQIYARPAHMQAIASPRPATSTAAPAPAAASGAGGGLANPRVSISAGGAARGVGAGLGADGGGWSGVGLNPAAAGAGGGALGSGGLSLQQQQQQGGSLSHRILARASTGAAVARTGGGGGGGGGLPILPTASASSLGAFKTPQEQYSEAAALREVQLVRENEARLRSQVASRQRRVRDTLDTVQRARTARIDASRTEQEQERQVPAKTAAAQAELAQRGRQRRLEQDALLRAEVARHNVTAPAGLFVGRDIPAVVRAARQAERAAELAAERAREAERARLAELAAARPIAGSGAAPGQAAPDAAQPAAVSAAAAPLAADPVAAAPSDPLATGSAAGAAGGPAAAAAPSQDAPPGLAASLPSLSASSPSHTSTAVQQAQQGHERAAAAALPAAAAAAAGTGGESLGQDLLKLGVEAGVRAAVLRRVRLSEKIEAARSVVGDVLAAGLAAAGHADRLGDDTRLQEVSRAGMAHIAGYDSLPIKVFNPAPAYRAPTRPPVAISVGAVARPGTAAAASTAGTGGEDSATSSSSLSTSTSTATSSSKRADSYFHKLAPTLTQTTASWRAAEAARGEARGRPASLGLDSNASVGSVYPLSTAAAAGAGAADARASSPALQRATTGRTVLPVRAATARVLFEMPLETNHNDDVVAGTGATGVPVGGTRGGNKQALVTALEMRRKRDLAHTVRSLSRLGYVVSPDIVHRLGLAEVLAGLALSGPDSDGGGQPGSATAAAAAAAAGGAAHARPLAEAASQLRSMRDDPASSTVAGERDAEMWSSLLSRNALADGASALEDMGDGGALTGKAKHAERLMRRLCQLALQVTHGVGQVHVLSMQSAEESQDWAKSGAVTERHARRRLQLLEHRRQEALSSAKQEQALSRHVMFHKPA